MCEGRRDRLWEADRGEQLLKVHGGTAEVEDGSEGRGGKGASGTGWRRNPGGGGGRPTVVVTAAAGGLGTLRPGFRGRAGFEGTADSLTQEGGGRHNPFCTNYRPRCYFRTTDGAGVITLREGTGSVRPGDTTDRSGGLIQPIAREEGLG